MTVRILLDMFSLECGFLSDDLVQDCSNSSTLAMELLQSIAKPWKYFVSGLFQGDLRTEKLSIERHFHQLKEERMRHLLDKLNLQERMRIDEMIDRQTSEMLVLMDKKAR